LLIVLEGKTTLEDDRPKEGLCGLVVLGFLKGCKSKLDGVLRLLGALEQFDHMHEEGDVQTLLVFQLHVCLHRSLAHVGRFLKHV